MTEAPASPLRSAIDVYLSERIAGWAWNPKHPAYTPSLDFEVNGTVVATIRCDRMRTDLREQGIGNGARAFDFNPREYLRPGRNHCRLILSRSRAKLPGGEQVITIPDTPPASQVPILRPDHVWDQHLDPAWFRRGDRPPPTHAQILGPFNSGTNYAHDLAARNGIAMTVQSLETLFFKHYPPAILSALAATDPMQSARALFVVMTRNPYDWIASMRRNPYGAVFRGIDGPFSISLDTLNKSVITYGEHLRKHLDGDGWQSRFEADNIVEYWNTYHADALAMGEAFAHLALLPYETAVLHPAETLVLLSCLLTRPTRQIISIGLGSAKPGHPWSGNYFDAKRKVARATPPADLSTKEIAFISEHIRADLCDRFGYTIW